MKEARNKLGMTQIDVSKAVGVSIATYQLWERGGSGMKSENRKKLEDVLQIKIGE